MSWTAFLPFVTGIQPLTGDKAVHWSKRNLPCKPIFHNELVPALCTVLGAMEIEPCHLVEAKFLDQEDFTNVTVDGVLNYLTKGLSGGHCN